MKKPLVTMIDQFNELIEKKRKPTKTLARGPVDLKALRQDLKAKDAKKNRKPF